MRSTKPQSDVENLWQRFKQNRDPDAEKKLIERYLSLVDQVVARIAPGLPASISREDLWSYGVFGLIDSVRKFDPDRGHQFVTYATWRIRGAIIDGLRTNDWLPRSLRDKAKKIEEAYSILEQKHMRSVTDEEVSRFLGISVQEMHKVLQETAVASFFSLDEPVMDDEEQESNRQSLIEDEKVAQPEEMTVRNQMKRILADAINRLPEKEKMVISLFYYEELTFTEIAEVMNLSTSRISQLHAKAIFRLRGALGRRKELLL